MRRLITVWLVFIAFLGRELLAPPVRPKRRNPHIPPLREDWYTGPAMEREMKREF